MKSLILRIVKQILNDKRSLALILVAPLLIISFIYLVFGANDYNAKVVLLDLPSVVKQQIRTTDLEVIDTDITIVDEILKTTDTTAVIYMQDNQLKIKFKEPDAFKTTKVTNAIKELISRTAMQQFELEFLYGDAQATIFENLGYMFIAIFAFFFVFILSGISFIRERTQGTLERFMLTPISRWEIVMGYILGFGIFAIMQSTLLIVYTHYALNLSINGSITLTIIIALLLAFVGVATGTAISVLANNEFQVVQFIPLIIIPQVFFAGMVPIETFPYHLDLLASIMPIYYASEALHKIIIFGAGWQDIWQEAIILCIFIVALFAINVLLLKKYRKI